jgi:U2-associated protein SR140
VRKSKREKEKEAADAKRKEEEEHAARAYAEFLDEFESEDVGKKKTASFVKSSTESKAAYYPLLGNKSEASSRSLRGYDAVSTLRYIRHEIFTE